MSELADIEQKFQFGTSAKFDFDIRNYDINDMMNILNISGDPSNLNYFSVKKKTRSEPFDRQLPHMFLSDRTISEQYVMSQANTRLRKEVRSKYAPMGSMGAPHVGPTHPYSSDYSDRRILEP